jgi:hypothetical protein
MAFTATITSIERIERTLNVVVTYADDQTGFTKDHTFNFDQGDVVSDYEVKAEIVKMGKVVLAGLANEPIIKRLQGAVIEF